MNAKLKRIVLIDPSVIGESHILVNTGFLRLFAAMADELLVITEDSHSNALRKHVNLDGSYANINYITYKDRSELNDLIRKSVSWRQIDLMFFLNLEYRIFFYCNLSARRYYTGPKCWVLHSHLASLGKESLRAKLVSRLKAFLLFNLFTDNRFVVLGENIKANARRTLSGFIPGERIHSVFHPVGVSSFEAKAIGPAKPRGRDMLVMFLHGWHRLPDDRLQTLVRLAETARTTGQFDFREILASFNSGPLGRSFSKQYSDRLNSIRAADFLLQLPTDPYSFQASGAIMDMVATRTPAIGIATDFGKDLESKIGRFGYFFDTDAELIGFMERFSDNYNVADHQLFISNLTDAGERLDQLARLSLASLVAMPR